MKLGKACAIFMQINSDAYSKEEKALAIYHVLKMPTHNGINKGKLLDVIRYLFEQQWEVEDAE